MYRIIRPLLFALPPETSHHITLTCLKLAAAFKLTSLLPKISSNPRTVMGLTFNNPLGLAAGFDKNGDYIEALFSLGFGFIEIGTLTPQPQFGNPKPRLFRIPQQRAIINRMGFNNQGVKYAAQRLAHISRPPGILGINLGKNKATPLSAAAEDYLYGMEVLWPYANYFTINISSPNTKDLRKLHQADLLTCLLHRLKNKQTEIHTRHQKYIPLVIKLSPDLAVSEIETTANILRQTAIDGIIATNTTIARDQITQHKSAHQAGGLSGQPLFERSTNILRELHQAVGNSIPIIASGGVMDKTTALAKYAAGAQLIQVYSGLIYHGIGLIRELADLGIGTQ